MRWAKIGGLGFIGGVFIGAGLECLAAGFRTIAEDIREDPWAELGDVREPEILPEDADGHLPSDSVPHTETDTAGEVQT